MKYHPLDEPYEMLFKAALSEQGVNLISEIIRRGADLNYVDPFLGRTTLYQACVSNSVSVIELLLKHGANAKQVFSYRSPVDGRVEQGVTALHYASSPEVVAALVRAGADVNAADASGTTPLMRAAFAGRIQVVNALLAAGASPVIRQSKRRGKQPCTARGLAELKIEMFRGDAFDVNNPHVQQRIKCYEQIRDILSEAEKKLVRPSYPQPKS